MPETNSEDKPLLAKNTSHSKSLATEIRFSTTKTIILSLATTLFNGSLQISNLTVNQYVYKWLDNHHVNETTIGNNVSAKRNNTLVCQINENSDENELQQTASHWLWYFTLTEYGLPLFTVLTLGFYSDFIGRKPLMLLSLFGNTIMSGLLVWFIYMDWYLAYFVIAFGVGGISGARYTFHIGYLGLVADTTEKSKARSFKIAILGIFMAFGRCCAQLTTGYVIKLSGYVYPLRSPFCYTPDMISWFQFSKECVQNIIGTALIKVFHRCCSDEWIVFIGCVTGTSYFVIEAFAKESSVLFIGIAVGILATVPFPLYKGIASRMVDDDKQGALFTVIVILQIIGRLSGTTAYNNLYARTQDWMAGLTFLVMGGCYILAALLILPLLVSRTNLIEKKIDIQSE